MKNDFFNFLKSYPSLINLDSGRAVSLFYFKQYINKHCQGYTALNIAIVSGSLNEPELLFFDSHIKVDLLSYEENSIFNLDFDWNTLNYSSYLNKYDIVLCNHVLEHVPNIKRAYYNLHLLLKHNGLLYISVPGINNIHSDPQYYYAGFHFRTLDYYASKFNFQILESSGFFSRKISLMHSVCDWSPVKYSLGFPYSLRYVSLKEFKSIIWILLDFLKYPGINFFDKQKKFLVTSWILAKKV